MCASLSYGLRAHFGQLDIDRFQHILDPPGFVLSLLSLVETQIPDGRLYHFPALVGYVTNVTGILDIFFRLSK